MNILDDVLNSQGFQEGKVKKTRKGMTMKRRMTILLTALLLTLLLAVPASAGQRIPAEGTASSEFDLADRTTNDIGGKCRIEIKPYVRHFEGTLEGTGTEHLTVLSQGPCADIYPGKYDDRFWFKGTFEGMVDGREGTCRYVGRGETWAGDPPIMDIRVKLMRCKGELQGMNGKLFMGWEDPYWGWVHFAQEH
jgi:hypothetical protein